MKGAAQSDSGHEGTVICARDCSYFEKDEVKLLDLKQKNKKKNRAKKHYQTFEWPTKDFKVVRVCTVWQVRGDNMAALSKLLFSLQTCASISYNDLTLPTLLKWSCLV